MTEKINDGGPVFPSEIGTISKGMTLRDYFAAKAMPLAFDYVRRINPDGYEDSVGGRSNSFNSTYDFTWHEESGSENGDVYMVAEFAYQMADAMLKARGQQ